MQQLAGPAARQVHGAEPYIGQPRTGCAEYSVPLLAADGMRNKATGRRILLCYALLGAWRPLAGGMPAGQSLVTLTGLL